MGSERIFNVFIYFEDGTATEYGVRHHRLASPDSDKLAFLRDAVEGDVPVARRFALRRSYTTKQWFAVQRQGVDFGLFEEALSLFRAPREPLLCVTAIVDGRPAIDETGDFSPLRGAQVGRDLPGDMEDWLEKYTEGNNFRFDKLINDDFFEAIRTLFQARRIASASKLLMSMIDTLAFVEYGDTQGNFTKWLDSYIDLKPVDITSTELWEFRNSIVHMTNLSSRKVLAGKVPTLVPYIGSPELAKHAKMDGSKPLDFRGLIMALGEGIKRWCESYNTDRDKFMTFIERYDTLISDSRLAEYQVPAG